MRNEVKIYKADGSVRTSVVIGRGSTAKFTLGKEDYITLKFTVASQISFRYGDYVNIQDVRNIGESMGFNLAGTFGGDDEESVFDVRVRNLCAKYYKLVNVSTPTYNESTGGFDYSLRMDAWYMEWSHRKLFLPYLANGAIVRKESNFSLTDKIVRHVYLVISNLVSLGIKYDGEYPYAQIDMSKKYSTRIAWDNNTNSITVTKIQNSRVAIDETIIEDDTNMIKYESNDIISVLGTIASTWECDWWVSGRVIHFGRKESSATPTIARVGYELKNITSSKSQSDFATRLYVFGGTKNMHPTYRKKLIFSSSAAGTNIKDDNRKVLPSWFRTRENGKKTDSFIDDVRGLAEERGVHVCDAHILSWGSGDNWNVVYAQEAISLMANSSDSDVTHGLLVEFGQGVTSTSIDTNVSINAGDTFEVQFPLVDLVRARDSNQIYPDSTIRSYNYYVWIVDDDGNVLETVDSGACSSISNTYTNESTHIYCSCFARNNIKCVAGQAGYIRLGIEPKNKAVIYYDIDTIKTSLYQKATTTITYEDGTTEDVVINGNCRPYSEANACDVVVSTSKAKGTKYTMSGLLWSKVPSSYYTTDDECAVINKISEVRLKLPNADYVDVANGLPHCEIIEEVKIIDDVYPHRVDTIDDLKTVEYTKTEKDEVTGAEKTTKWDAYRFKATLASEDFSNDYKLDGEDLQITFNSGDLAGMTFVVAYNNTSAGEASQPEVINGVRNPDATWFEIIANENYGVRLPNETLKPGIDDEFVLFGYDTSYMATDLLEEAEEKLEKRAKFEIQKMIHNDATYDVTFLAHYLVNESVWFGVGDRLTLNTPNYYEATRNERIIGYEIALDIPVDGAKFTCGESPVYSRTKAIESKIKLINH